MTGAPAHWRRFAAAVPDWRASPRVQAFVTGRHGGVSSGVWGLDGGRAGGLNLGAGCGDDPRCVAENRRRLALALPSEPVWLRQVHGADVHVVETAAPDESAAAGAAPDAASPARFEAMPGRAEAVPVDPATVEPGPVVADAAVTAQPGRVLAVLTADCLPVLVADRDGRAIGVAHAGWRGLSGGVLENTVAALRSMLPPHAHLQAWLGPAIGPDAFEVGRDVLEAFCDLDPACRDAFAPGRRPDRWFADLYRLARRRLSSAGVVEVAGGGFCTYADRARFWSYRREPPGGRMASVIWIKPASTAGA